MIEGKAETSPELVAFGSRVREERKRRRWTLENLADAALKNGDRKGYISEIERGIRPGITGDTIRKIAAALDITIEEADGAIIVPSADGEIDRTPLEIRLDSLAEDASRAANASEALLERYGPQIEFLTKELHATQSDLLQLLGHILQDRVAPADIQGAITQAWEKLKELRSERGSWAGLPNEEAEIVALLQQADDALSEGPGFSLEKAEKALAAADKRYAEIIEAREEQTKNGKISRAKIIGKRAEMAALKFAYLEASDLYQEQAKLHEQTFRSGSEEYASSLNKAAIHLDDAGLYSKAEPLFRRGLEIHQQVLGEDHPDTAGSYNNVAFCMDA